MYMQSFNKPVLQTIRVEKEDIISYLYYLCKYMYVIIYICNFKQVCVIKQNKYSQWTFGIIISTSEVYLFKLAKTLIYFTLAKKESGFIGGNTFTYRKKKQT